MFEDEWKGALDGGLAPKPRPVLELPPRFTLPRYTTRIREAAVTMQEFGVAAAEAARQVELLKREMNSMMMRGLGIPSEFLVPTEGEIAIGVDYAKETGHTAMCAMMLDSDGSVLVLDQWVGELRTK